LNAIALRFLDLLKCAELGAFSQSESVPYRRSYKRPSENSIQRGFAPGPLVKTFLGFFSRPVEVTSWPTDLAELASEVSGLRWGPARAKVVARIW